MTKLEQYRSKREFAKTPEPAPRGRRRPASKPPKPQFVVQKHAARTLHYDFRLELDGVLVSWAVPKGPSLDPSTKRLAIETEDHPLEYGTFEGVIPKGQYGSGTVLVWDRGRWYAQGDPRESYAKGHLKFALEGEKLKGTWHLVRRGERKNWLLFKSRDKYARRARVLVNEAPDSVLSGRSLQEVSEGAKSKEANRASTERPRVTGQPFAMPVPGALPAKFPQRVAPELATLVREVPRGDAWLHELKFDGYRVLARIEKGRARCMTRTGNDWTHRLTSLARELQQLPVDNAILDGEACVLNQDGSTDFQRLQNSLSQGADERLVYFTFDLLYWNGLDLRELPLEERKRYLEALLNEAGQQRIRYSDHVTGCGPQFFEQVCARGLEGIISKRANSRYVSRRSRDWLKVKCVRGQAFVIGGFTEPGGSRTHFGSLLVGSHDSAGQLVYRGKVGTGFNQKTLRDVHAKLEQLETKRPPFSNPPAGAVARGVHWVEPRLLAEVAYTEVTDEGLLRHPRFKGLRQDKPIHRIKLEKPVIASTAHDDQTRAEGLSLPITLTHPERVLYAEQAITKQALAEYYVQVARWMLPHVGGRILTLVRCPEGARKGCFYQKHLTKGMPPSLKPVAIREKNKSSEYITLNDAVGLVSLVQTGALEVHAWGAHADKPERPDQLVFDLDPGPGVDWEQVIEGAQAVRAVLADLGLESFVKATGSRGLHVTLPVRRRLDWETTKAFCKGVAQAICQTRPSAYVCNMSKAKRQGRIFVDYLRNGRGATSICPFSTRALPGAPVAATLNWDELLVARGSDCYSVETMPERLASLERDPWHGYFELQQSITKPMLRALGVKV